MTHSSLRIVGTVGEPINQHAWEWRHQVGGRGLLPHHDTRWQTATGAAMTTPPLPHAWDTRPGSVTLPFIGVQPVPLTDKGGEINGHGDGCGRDKDGCYWIIGCVVINFSGHRVETAEVGSALTSHDACAEAAVIGVPHAIKGEACMLMSLW